MFAHNHKPLFLALILCLITVLAPVFAASQDGKGTLSGNMVHTILVPQQLTATTQSDVFNMAMYNHATIIISVGVAATPTFVATLEYCDDNTPTTDTAMAYNYRQVTDGAGASDTWGDLTAATSAGITLGTAQQTTIIEIDANEVYAASSGANSRLALKLTDPAAADSYVCVVVILSEPRFASETPVTCIN